MHRPLPYLYIILKQQIRERQKKDRSNFCSNQRRSRCSQLFVKMASLLFSPQTLLRCEKHYGLGKRPPFCSSLTSNVRNGYVNGLQDLGDVKQHRNSQQCGWNFQIRPSAATRNSSSETVAKRVSRLQNCKYSLNCQTEGECFKLISSFVCIYVFIFQSSLFQEH